MHHTPPNPKRRRILLGAASTATGTLLGAASLRPAMAQIGPGPVQFILPLSVGSGVDAIARAASQALGDALHRSVVIDNQPGAGGIVGTQAIARATPNGNTLGFVSNNHVIFPSVIKALTFDPIQDITPISIVCTSPLLLVANPSLPANDLKSLEALLRQHPDKYNMGSSGNGTILQLAAQQFLQEAKVDCMHIPYRGSGPLVTAMLAGQVDWGVIALPAIRGHLESGSLKALCTCTPQRLASMPAIPTAVEQGYPNYVVEGWVAVIGPKGLSESQVRTIHDALKVAYSQPSVKDAMDKQGNVLQLSTPEHAAQYFVSEAAKYAALARASGLEPQ